MATLTWTGAASDGDWNDPLNWSINGQPAGRIPGSSDDVDMGGLPHLPFPTLSSNATVNSLVVNETTFVASGATLDVADSLSVVSSFVDMSFDVAGTTEAGAIANLDVNGILTGEQRAHFVVEAGGTLVDLGTFGTPPSEIKTLQTNLTLGAGSKFEVAAGGNLTDVTASLTTISGSSALTNTLTLIGHNVAFANSIDVVSNGFIELSNDAFRAADLSIDASSIVGGVGSIAVASQSITNDGQLWSRSQGTSSLVIANDVVGTGSVRLFDGSTLEFAGAVAGSETINFDAPETGEKLIIDAVNASGVAATLHGFTTLDAIDLTHTAAKSATLDGADLLSLRDANGATVGTLQLTGDYTGKTFLVSGDGGAGSLLTVFTNEPPVTTAPANEIASKGTSFAFTGADQISVADPDASSGIGEAITVVLSDTTGLLSAFVAGSGGGAEIAGSGTQQLTISGSLGQVNAALGTLSFLDNAVGSDQIEVATSDGRGGSDDHKIAVSVVANQPPVTTAPASELVSSKTPFAFMGADQVSVADPDAQSGTGETITVLLTDTAGLLSAFVSGSGGGANITGSGTQQLTISGGLGQVNAALATLSFLGNSVGPDQIDVATSDGRGGSDDHKIAVSVVANQPPVTTVPASELVSSNTPFAFTGADRISVADPDAQSGTGETITVVLTDTAGLLSAFIAGSGGGAHVTGNATQQLTISGGLNQVNAALASLSFISNTLGPDQIDVASSDGRGGSDDHKVAVSVVANQPPATTVPASEIVSKGTPFAFTGAGQISVTDPDALSGPGENITVVLTDAAGLLSASSGGSGSGASITGDGTQQLTISGGLGQVNAALATLSFLGNTVGPDQIDVATSDGRGGSDDHKIGVTVTPSTNVPFSIVAPSTVLTGVNQAGSIGGLSLVESPTTPGETFTIAISDGNGALSASTLAPGGGGTIVNNGPNTLTITGTLDQVNADLSTLTDTNTSTAPDSLFMVASNSNGESAPVVLVDVSVNGAPTITTPSDVRAPAGLASPVPLMKVSETGNTMGEVFVVILSDANGLLSATFGGNPVAGSGTNHLTLSGDLNQVNAELASLKITETAVGLDFITGGVGDGFGNGSGQFRIPVVGAKTWTSTTESDPDNWNNAANWTTLGAPGAGQDVFIPGTGIQPVIYNGATGTIGGIVTNNGTIKLDSNGLQTTLLVSGDVALEGAGFVVLSDSPLNSIVSAGGAATLENAQTISGAGLINVTADSNQSLAFHNDFNGTVNATGLNALAFGPPSFFPGGLITNDGLMEASGTGGLVLQAVDVTNNGTIQANNGSHVDLSGDVIISGGTLSTNGTGVIRSVVGDSFSDSAAPILDGTSNGALANSGTVEIGATDKLVITGTINNSGIIHLLGNATQAATLFIQQATKLQGTGSLVLSDSPLNSIISVGGAATLENAQTLSGAGLINVTADSNQSLAFHNDFNGTVNATGVSALAFGPPSFFPSGLIINDGLMEASGTGGLVLQAVDITNNGTIQANNGSHVDLSGVAIISGGTLNTNGTGVIRSVVGDNFSDGFAPILDGTSNGALSNLGTVDIGATDRLVITGTINNSGIIHLLGNATQAATLFIQQATKLQGTGSLVLSDSPLNSIISVGGAATLENAQTISGAGLISVTGEFNPSLAFHNDVNGTVNATGVNALTLGIPSFFPNGLITNDGRIEASGTGGLVLQAVDITNNGTIQANNGSHVDLSANVIISGGTLSTSGTGVIRSVVGSNFSDVFAPVLDGVSNGALSNLGTVDIGATDKLVITGTINNSGTINLLGNATQGSTLFIDQNTTLQGKGSLDLSDSSSNVIEADAFNATLDNRQSIVGAGFIDVDTDLNRSLLFQNDGIISATGTNALVFEANLGLSPGHVTNNGLMEAFGAGGLVFANAFVANSNGIIQANNGSQVDLGNETTILGGTLSTTGTGVIRTVGDDINSAFGPRLDGSINPLVNAGTVEIDGNTSLAIIGTINNNGTVRLAGGSAQPATLLVEFSATLRGNGSVALSDSSSNIITGRNSDISSLDNQQTISGAGFINVSSDVARFLSLLNDTTGIINATGSNALVINGQPSIFGPAQVTNDGLIEATGTGGLVFKNASVVNNNGLIEAFSGSHVDFVDAQLSGAGGLLFIDPNATVTFRNASAASGQTIQFLKGANETLVLDDATINSTTIGAHISGFAIGDKIDLAQLKVTSAAIDGSARVHLLSGTTEIGSLQLNPGNLGERFVVTSDGGAGTLLAVGVSIPPQVTESLANDTGASATDRLTNDPTLTGIGDPFAIVSLSEGGVHVGTTTADATGAWSFTPTNLSQGTHAIIASETNAAGTGHASLTFTYDSVGPKIAITTPDAQVADPLLTLSGTGETGTKVQLFDNALSTGGLVTVDASGHWSEQIMLAGTGTHFIIATDTDLAGNLVTSTVSTFGLDNQINAPSTQRTVTGTSGADHITISQGNILVSAAAGNDTITLTPGGNFQFHFLNGGSGSDTLDLSQIPGNVTANLAQGLLIGNQIGFSVLNSIENITAGSGHERLIGSSGANVFEAGAGHDVITGRGGGDTFVFKAGFGNAVITDFHVATTNANPHDVIELDHALFSQFATVQALLSSSEVSQHGASVVIAVDPSHTIELQHTSLRTLAAHANDVLFV